MSELAATGANAEQIEFWNGKAAAAWVAYQAQMDALLAPLSDPAIVRAAARAGEQVLDIGCGCGATTLSLGSAGAKVTGIDISAPMLEVARQRASAMVSSAQFVLADASAYAFKPEHDLLFSRFGVMFFADATAAFANLRSALKASGRFTFICWRAPALNPWMAIPMAAAAPFLPQTPPLDPRAPGPFAFADRDYLTSVLSGAGFKQAAIEDLKENLVVGSNIDEAMNFTSRVGPLSRPLAAMDDATRDQALAALRKVLTQHMQNGAVSLGARCWIVSARA